MSYSYNRWSPRDGHPPPPPPPPPYGPGPSNPEYSHQAARFPPHPPNSIPEQQRHPEQHYQAIPHHVPGYPVAAQPPYGNSTGRLANQPPPPGHVPHHHVEYGATHHSRDPRGFYAGYHGPPPGPDASAANFPPPGQEESMHARSYPSSSIPTPSTMPRSEPRTPYHQEMPSTAMMGLSHMSPRSPPLSSASEPGTTLSGIPNLLEDDKADLIAGIQFRLTMRQQPKAARACGSGERDRRNIDPPPIIQLNVEAPGLNGEDIDKYLHYEGYVMNCWIYDETGKHDASHMPSEYRYQRRLTGSLVGTPFYGRDEFGRGGCFFPFSDLSVRTLGRYRLKFNLIMLNLPKPGQHRHFPVLTEIFSDVFDVYTAKEFPGINESSKLVRTLREQGCIIAIKKGNDKKNKKSKDDSEDDEEMDDGETSQGKRKRLA